MTQAHDDAVIARIRQDAKLAECVFDGELPKKNPDGTVFDVPQRYVLVHSNRGVARASRLAGLAIERRKTYWVHSVGLSKRQAESVAERVLAKLVNWTPQVAGWDSRRMQHESSQPVQKDESGKPPVYFGVDTFDLETTPDVSADPDFPDPDPINP